jgi:hypothetical protein
MSTNLLIRSQKGLVLVSPHSYQRNKVTVTGPEGDSMIRKPEGEVVAKTTGSKQISSLNIFQKSVTAATQLFCCDGA